MSKLTREDCEKCGETTLHVSMKCIHCHHQIPTARKWQGPVNSAMKRGIMRSMKTRGVRRTA